MTNSGQKGPFFFNRIMGAVAALLTVALVAMLVWLMIYVVQPLTSTTSVTDRLVEHLLAATDTPAEVSEDASQVLQKGNARKDASQIPQKNNTPEPSDNGSGEIDRETIRLLMALENAAAPIRVATLQVATAILGGFFLIVIGVLLFAAGATGVFSAEAKHGNFSISLRDITPGIAAALLGGLVIALGVNRDISPTQIQYSNRSAPNTRGDPSTRINLNTVPFNDAPPDSLLMEPSTTSEEKNIEERAGQHSL